MYFIVKIAEATPKKIVQAMGVKSLTLSHVKSHLQVIIYTQNMSISITIYANFQCVNIYICLCWCLLNQTNLLISIDV